MRSTPRREAPGGAAAVPSRRTGRPQPEHPVLRLQRSAGNAAVTKLLRAQGDATATAETKPSTVDFLNTYTPLFRGLLAKYESGEPLDRIDLDTLRELRAGARKRGLANLVAELDDLHNRAAMRGIVHAPEEAAPEVETEEEPAPDPIDVDALAASLSAMFVASIKQRLRDSRDTSNESVRGGRYVGSVGGVQYALYQIDDVLLTYQDAQQIETLIRAVREMDVPSPPKDEDLWRTVVQLLGHGHSPAEVMALLKVTAEPPSITSWFQQWFTHAVQALNAQPGKHVVAEEEPGASIPREKLPLESADKLLRKRLIEQHAKSSGLEYSGPMKALERLNRERQKLIGLRKRYVAHPSAHLETDGFDALAEGLTELRVLANSIQTLFESGDSANLLGFDTTLIDAAISRTYRAEVRLRNALAELESNALEGEEAVGTAKKYVKTEKKGDEKKKREGGVDGIFDPGFDPGKMETWVKRIKRAMDDKNVGDCVAYIQVFKGRGGGTSTSYGGRMVFHISHGFSEGGDGCTLFFTQDEDGVITIVAIGSHDDRYTTAYRIDWQLDGWSGGDWHINTLILKK